MGIGGAWGLIRGRLGGRYVWGYMSCNVGYNYSYPAYAPYLGLTMNLQEGVFLRVYLSNN